MYVCMPEHPNRFEKNRETQLSREKEKLLCHSVVYLKDFKISDEIMILHKVLHVVSFPSLNKKIQEIFS